MAITSCLSYVEDDDDVWTLLNNIKDSLREWKNYGPEVVQCGQRMMQALFSEGFEDTRTEAAERQERTLCSLSLLSNIIIVTGTEPQTPIRNLRSQLKMTLLVCMGTTLHGIIVCAEEIVAQLIPAVRKRAHILKR
ncbi:hypothetical protein BLNAU_25194 [Blattamonas nauphoetae]|uniref:Uncharacterized protein n=1 Tax=Blattamonas nauphoetae TaxID=2049346 RepID=A0ABQ9WKA9_9EUKA|nr:hypothetical protein BLNAU_25194 [Blattamonas nauphoetae]